MSGTEKTSTLTQGLVNRPGRLSIKFTQPSMAQQHCVGACDLNDIVDQNFNFKDPGYLNRLVKAGLVKDPQKAMYADFTQAGITDYQEAMQVVQDAKSRFMMLPAKARDYFENSPSKFLDFVAKKDTDDSVFKKGCELGLWLSARQELINKTNEGALYSQSVVNRPNVSVNIEPQPVQPAENAGEAGVSG